MPPETTPAGATPVEPGATPGQSAPAQPASGSTTAAATEPATGTDDALGEKGLAALKAERDARREAEERAKTAEKALEAARLAGASEAEKALAAAKEQGRTEVVERLHASVRRTAVREALLTAGAVPSLVSDLSRADEFASLKVNDDDEIDQDGLAKALKAHKARVPDAYRAPGDSGSADGGARGSGKGRSDSLEDSIAAHYEGKA